MNMFYTPDEPMFFLTTCHLQFVALDGWLVKSR